MERNNISEVRTIDKQFEALWDEFSFELGNFIKSKVSQVHDAEDILQEVFIKIFKNIDQLEKQSALKSWMYKITRNTIIDYYKKKRDLPVAPETMHFIEDEVEEEDNMNDQITGCLKKMIFEVPEKYQQVYDLHENKKMKHKEIGEELNISLSTSKVRLMRAKELFKKNLIECCDFELDSYGNIIDYKKKSCEECDSCKSDDDC